MMVWEETKDGRKMVLDDVTEQQIYCITYVNSGITCYFKQYSFNFKFKKKKRINWNKESITFCTFSTTLEDRKSYESNRVVELWQSWSPNEVK